MHLVSAVNQCKMDEAETKTCTNCKREIPAVNFTIHTVHCARNIKICPVCKEPVLQAELQDHHEKMHKLLPCSKCGERVCGTDLEDHVRDSCAHTIKSCRYCELELPRRELPAHEGYCGVRTEQCAQCREWVMIKYRQLHLDSNHGFVRLDDDPTPAPKPKKEPAKASNLPYCPLPELVNGPWGDLSALFAASPTNGVKNTNVVGPRTEIRPLRSGASAEPVAGGSGAGAKLPLKRTNDQPQINTSVTPTDKVSKELGMSRGAVKKRPAPKPPALPNPDPRRDMAYYSAMQRQQDEERRRQEQTAINLSQGLPPVLNPAQKLERLRKMDALHNREAEPPRRPRPDDTHEPLDRKNEFKNLKPMSPEEFMKRFNELQVERGWERDSARGDRFSEIKSSLRELRRGLNEVTAPYNSNSSNNDAVVDRSNVSRRRLAEVAEVAEVAEGAEGEEEVRLPCEFCDALVPQDHLVQHQTGCRPDLAQRKPRPMPLRQIQNDQQKFPAPPRDHDDELPVIPCEFCTESLPVYLIQDHQERCRREAHLLYPD